MGACVVPIAKWTVRGSKKGLTLIPHWLAIELSSINATPTELLLIRLVVRNITEFWLRGSEREEFSNIEFSELMEHSSKGELVKYLDNSSQKIHFGNKISEKMVLS